MSEIKVNSIKGVGASAAAITVNNTDGTCTANITNNLSNRNLIINGAMQVVQRGTSSTASSSGYYACDRWRIGAGGLDEAVTVAQSALTSSDTPYSSGFRFATKITNGNQTNGLGATDYVSYGQRLEGQDIHNSGWDFTSTSSKITISFWIKSSVAQTFYSRFRIKEASADKEYVFAVAATTSWQKITKTISGASGLNPLSNTDMGFFWDIILAYGSDYTGSMTLDQWNTVNTSAYVPDMTSTWYTTNDATFELTGVQLEVSDHATDFEHRSFAQELTLCQRYFYLHADPSESSSSNNQVAVGMGTYYGNPDYFCAVHFPVKMRATPSLVTGTGSNNFVIYRNNGSDYENSVGVIDRAGTTGCMLYINSASGTAGQGGFLSTYKAGATVAFNSEL